MSEVSALERLAVEMAAMRRDLASMARMRGDRLTRADVCERLGIHRNTLPRVIREGFPRPAPDGKWLLWRIIEWDGARFAAERAEDRAPDPLEELEQLFPPDGKTHHLYRHFDAAGTLLYVGISLHAVIRLAQHGKDAAWFSQIARVEIQSFPTRAASRAAERRAILTEGPAHNIKMNTRKAA